jgi:Mn2+/Fe2+ NRAMP family transporter
MALVFIAYIPAALKAERHWDVVLRALATPTLDGPHSAGLVAFLIPLVGTTISPYMQFFVQSAVAEKGVRPRDYRYTRVEVVASSLFAILVALFIMIATAAALYGRPGAAAISDAGTFALALEPILGAWAGLLFAIGLFGASLLAATVLPLSTAFAICEVFGFESGVEKTYGEAPVFYGIFTGLIVLGVVVALVLPAQALVAVLVSTQAVNGIILIMVLLFLLRLVNNRRLMGRHVNGPIVNAIARSTATVLTVLTILLLLGTVFHVGPAAA